MTYATFRELKAEPVDLVSQLAMDDSADLEFEPLDLALRPAAL
jgi:hypothetical protein